MITYINVATGELIPANHRVMVDHAVTDVKVTIRSKSSVSLDRIVKLLQQEFEIVGQAEKTKETIFANDIQVNVNW